MVSYELLKCFYVTAVNIEVLMSNLMSIFIALSCDHLRTDFWSKCAEDPLAWTFVVGY